LLLAGCFLFYPIRNQQPAIGNVFISPSPLSSPRRLSITHIFIYIIRSRYILIFEENYGLFVALSSLLTPNFNALLNPIQGLLRKPRLPLTANSLLDFFSTVFYEKISGIPAS